MKALLAFTIFIISFANICFAQDDSGFIYGKVMTKQGNAYVGQIRWGNEETFWTDIFNSVKTYGQKVHVEINMEEDNNIESEKKNEYRWEILQIWDDEYSNQVHQFACRFGDIKTIVPQPNSEVILIFKNDHKVTVRGGSNDIGAQISVYDYEIGSINVSWGDISEITFFDTPKKLEKKPGKPVYGTVLTSSGEFRGLIAWDNDERIDTDEIDGIYNQNEIQIPFKDIICLEKSGCATIIKLSSGSEMKLTGSNDVDCSNRGIYVSDDAIGNIEIPWTHFSKLCIDKTSKYSGDAFRSYGQPKRLSGTVKIINRGAVKGTIIFDKDEIWDFELLDGSSQGLSYAIPFRYIRRISPKNYDFAEVTLRNGKSIILGNSQDVSSRNEGIVVLKNDREKPIVINWTDIDEIVFD